MHITHWFYYSNNTTGLTHLKITYQLFSDASLNVWSVRLVPRQ